MESFGWLEFSLGGKLLVVVTRLRTSLDVPRTLFVQVSRTMWALLNSSGRMGEEEDMDVIDRRLSSTGDFLRATADGLGSELYVCPR